MAETTASRREAFDQLKPCDKTKPYIFISYSSRDWERICKDVRELQRRGYNVWIDEKNLDKTQDSWKNDALGAIRSYCCKFVIFYVSSASLTSPQCLAELQETYAQKTVDVHFGEVKFICIDVEQLGDIRDAARRIAGEIENDPQLANEKKETMTEALSVFLRSVFNSNNERVRIHPADEPDRKSDYYAEIMTSLPKQTKVFEAEMSAEKKKTAASADIAVREEKKSAPAPARESKPELPDKPVKSVRKEPAPATPAVVRTEATQSRSTVTYREIGTLKGHTLCVNSAAYCFPGGQTIVTAASDHTAKVWDAESFRELGALEGHTSWVTSTAYSPNGRIIVTASGDNFALVWDAETFRMLGALEGHTGPVNSAAYSPDGRRIVTASRDCTAKVWDTKTFQKLGTLPRHTKWINSAAYSPDGCAIVTASNDGTAKVWDTKTFQKLGTLKGHMGWVNSAAYSPDGRIIVTASWDKTAKVWDAETFRELGTLKGHLAYVTSAAYSPDGRTIVTASDDNTAKVWDAETFREITTLTGHTDGIKSASFSPDSKRIVTASEDRTARIWEEVT